MMRKIVCGAALLISSSALSAATITVKTTLDLTKGFHIWSDTNFDPLPSVDLAEGDTLDLTIDFAGSQQLTMNNPIVVWATLANGSPESFVTASGTLSLLDANGDAFLSAFKTDTTGSVGFGSQFYASDFPGGLPSTLTFSGVHYKADLVDYALDGLTTRHYSQLIFLTMADKMTISDAVPEPASWALLIGGFACAGAALRRRSAQLSFR